MGGVRGHPRTGGDGRAPWGARGSTGSRPGGAGGSASLRGGARHGRPAQERGTVSPTDDIHAHKPRPHSAFVSPLPLLPSAASGVLHLQPGVVDGRGHGRGDGGGADVPDDVQGLPQGVVHAQHLVPVGGLLR